MTNFVVHGGRMAAVTFGAYVGTAGLQDADGQTSIAFTAPFRDIKEVQSGTVDGEPVTVTGVSRSKLIEGMVVLTVAAVTPSPT